MDKNLIKFCIENGLPFIITFDKPWINDPLEEYNTDTSTGHPTFEGDDIVRTLMKIKEIGDKEPL